MNPIYSFFIPTLFLSHIILAQDLPWYASPNTTMVCEQFSTENNKLIRKLTVKNKSITLIDYEKDETALFEATQVRQVRNSKIWSSKFMELVIGIKPARFGQIFGGPAYYSGSIEIMLDKNNPVYHSLFCNPEAPKA
ncbi:MAG: hypothetical protein ACK5V3_08595 [Bdellovibrionales bacterium]